MKTFTFQKEKFLSGAEEWQVGSVDYLASSVKIRIRNPKGMREKTNQGQRAGRDAKEATRNKEDKYVIHFDDNKVVSLCVASHNDNKATRHTEGVWLSADWRRVAQKDFKGNS